MIDKTSKSKAAPADLNAKLFDGMAARAALPSPAERTLRHLVLRDVALKAQLADADALAKAVAAQPNPRKAEARMAAEVARVLPIVADVAAHLGHDMDVDAIADQPVAQQYQVLATAGYVEPSEVLYDFPATPTLCEISTAIRDDKYPAGNANAAQQQSIQQQINAAITLFATRWRAIAGTMYQPGDIPEVGDLVRLKAPVPLRPAWTDALAAREANALNAETPPNGNGAGGNQPGGNGNGNGSGNGASGSSGTGSRTSPRRDAVVDGTATTDGGNADGNGADGNGVDAGAALMHTCDANDLMVNAGMQPLRPPVDAEPRYTFPGQLLQREHIFYDYAVVVPVDECGPLRPEIASIDHRSIDAVRASAAQIHAVLDFLDSFGLSDVLGTYPAVPDAAGNLQEPPNVAAETRDLLSRVMQVDEQTSLTDVRAWKRRMRTAATLVRSAARRRQFIGKLGDANPRASLEKLAIAIADVPDYRLYEDDKMRRNQDGNEKADYLEIEGLRPGNVRAVYGDMVIDDHEQVRSLSRYLFYLAGPFKDALDGLKQAAIEMRDAVDKSKGNSEQLLKDFQRLAEGQINDALYIIARLLDDIAEQLPLWSERWGEGSKRLGLLMIYRQYWTPEGYVKGKLVGHKNLMPAQKERIHRRTFVKRLGEEQTVQEFARSQQNDYTRTQKETSEIVKENTNKFDFSLSASGGFDIVIGSLDVTSTNTISIGSMSRAAQSSIAEASMKATMSYNEKREVKLREETTVEQETDSVIEVVNPNQEITANYFYYQLLRQYSVTVELHDLRPVLLRTRAVPSEPEIDEKFLADNAHILINVLPAQLSSDLENGVGDIEALARAELRARSVQDERRLALTVAENRVLPAGDPPEAAREHEARLQSLREALTTATKELQTAEDAYQRVRSRLDRVVAHVRQNICHYMQFIWQASPRTDYDKILRTETFGGLSLPQLTRGLMRQGYHGDEEIFDFVGPSMALAEALVRTMTPGSDFSTLSDDELRDTELFQQLARQYSEEELDDVIAQMRGQAFITDPQASDQVLSSRRVQVAQDALVVEAMPGQVPLLEGYKMAHRMLDLERACLENHHLAARTGDQAWRNGGEDSYRVYRRDGQPVPVDEEGNES